MCPVTSLFSEHLSAAEKLRPKEATESETEMKDRRSLFSRTSRRTSFAPHAIEGNTGNWASQAWGTRKQSPLLVRYCTHSSSPFHINTFLTRGLIFFHSCPSLLLLFFFPPTSSSYSFSMSHPPLPTPSLLLLNISFYSSYRSLFPLLFLLYLLVLSSFILFLQVFLS